MEEREIPMLRVKVLTLYHVREDISQILEETKIQLRNRLKKKQTRRKRYEEINNKINKKI